MATLSGLAVFQACLLFAMVQKKECLILRVKKRMNLEIDDDDLNEQLLTAGSFSLDDVVAKKVSQTSNGLSVEGSKLIGFA